LRELWQAQVAQHTGLTGQELMDGAVDVQWFHRAYGTLGAERWGEVYRAALYASGGLGHKRAQLFADAMLSQIPREAIFSRVKDKRQGDAVRSLGLLPLPHDGRAEEIQARYAVIQAFLRTSRQFGSQRQASEKLAATIGLENLARTAGYPDPLRLQWAMEARAASDLAAGQGVVTVGEVRVALQFNGDGEADLLVAKAGKPLKAIPAAVKKDPAVKALSERKAEIKRQAVRMRRALEQAMCRGDSFTGEELRELSAHPVLAGQLSGLVLIGERKTGYLTRAAQSLRRHDGVAVPLGVDEAVRIAHPHDLLNRGEWHLWQSECVRAGRSQPFKQIFRELYLLTEAECADGVVSRRYAGHQVQSRQGQALLGTRGWVTHFEEGTSRTFHEQNLTAWLGIANGMWTPAEVEGPTVEGVWFTRRGDRRPLPLEQVPPLVFSETMRDLDLLVSVAHMGGVDPEATASTAEMRAALVRETCAMLKLENVRIQNRHVLVEGQLGSYSIHLGSGIVHRQPGGALCIVPVHAQHRGRLFLPFVDNDPQTAEVLSKVLLLARDREIKDPVILQQILA
ncbi:MAG TPA: DUF5724 domain-containing protein, partial [Anaerolineae bacterium]